MNACESLSPHRISSDDLAIPQMSEFLPTASFLPYLNANYPCSLPVFSIISQHVIIIKLFSYYFTIKLRGSFHIDVNADLFGVSVFFHAQANTEGRRGETESGSNQDQTTNPVGR